MVGVDRSQGQMFLTSSQNARRYCLYLYPTTRPPSVFLSRRLEPRNYPRVEQ